MFPSLVTECDTGQQERSGECDLNVWWFFFFFVFFLTLSAIKLNTTFKVLEKRYCAFQQHADSKIQSSTNKSVFHSRQSNVRRLLPASDYCRASGDQIVEYISDNETTLGSSQKLGGAAEGLIDDSEKRICRLSFEF